MNHEIVSYFKVFLRRDTTGKNTYYAPVSFEFLGFLAFHNYFFCAAKKKTSRIHFEVFILLNLSVCVCRFQSLKSFFSYKA